MFPFSRHLVIVASLTFACLQALVSVSHAEVSTFYVGTYTRGTDSKGIYVYKFDDVTGTITPASIAEGAENPSFLALHPNQKFLYSADEVDSFDGQPQGAVSAWAIDERTGELKLLNQQGAGGTSPCHLIVDPAGRNVLAVGYGSGTVAVLPIDELGKLQPTSTLLTHHGSSVDKSRQTSPHPHQIVLDANARIALVPDLGLDRIVAYQFDTDAGKLTANDPPFTETAPGAGPRHIAFSPDHRHVFVINELDLTITAFDYGPKSGTLTPRETVEAIADGVDRTDVSGAEIVVHPSGKLLYVSLRGTDEIVAYRIDTQSGALEFIERISTGGKTPRNFAVDPSGKWLLAANQNSGNIKVFRIEENGQLTATDQHASVPSPVCLEFLAP
jgi:6-phosphogluconolactonase